MCFFPKTYTLASLLLHITNLKQQQNTFSQTYLVFADDVLWLLLLYNTQFPHIICIQTDLTLPPTSTT